MAKNGSKMSSDHRLTRTNSVKPKLSPRRDFGPAQDFPRRQYSLKAGSNFSRPHLGLMKKKKTLTDQDILTNILSTKVSKIIFNIGPRFRYVHVHIFFLFFFSERSSFWNNVL